MICTIKFSTCIPCSAMTPPVPLGPTSLPLQIQLFCRLLKTKGARNLWSSAGLGSSTPEVSSVSGFGLRPQFGLTGNPKECFSSNMNVNLQLERSTPWHPLCRLRWKKYLCLKRQELLWNHSNNCKIVSLPLRGLQWSPFMYLLCNRPLSRDRISLYLGSFNTALRKSHCLPHGSCLEMSVWELLSTGLRLLEGKKKDKSKP